MPVEPLRPPKVNAWPLTEASNTSEPSPPANVLFCSSFVILQVQHAGVEDMSCRRRCWRRRGSARRPIRIVKFAGWAGFKSLDRAVKGQLAARIQIDPRATGAARRTQEDVGVDHVDTAAKHLDLGLGRRGRTHRGELDVLEGSAALLNVESAQPPDVA